MSGRRNAASGHPRRSGGALLRWSGTQSYKRISRNLASGRMDEVSGKELIESRALIAIP